MFDRRGANRAAVERFRQHFSELYEPIHFRGPGCRHVRVPTHLLTFTDLMNQKYDRQDHEPGNELEAAAVVDLTRTVEQRPQLARRDDPDSNG